MGRLGRVRHGAMAAQGREALPDHSDDLFQLRSGLRAGRGRREGHQQDPPLRGQSRTSRQPRPQLRQRAGDAQSSDRSRTHPLSAKAGRQTRRRQMGAGQLGRSAGRHRRTGAQGAPRRAAQRNHVPRRPARPRAALSSTHSAFLGHRRPQQPHQRLFRRRPRRLCLLVRHRPAVARSCQRALYFAPELAPGDRSLFQSSRAAHHRSQRSRHQDLRHRHAALQHRIEGGLLDVDLAGQRVGRAPGDVQCAPARGSVRPRVRASLGQLGRIFARRTSGQAA